MNLSGGQRRGGQRRVGARVGGAILAFVVGAVFGLLGTIAHQAHASVLGVTVPWGFSLALMAVLSLLIGLRMVLGDRLIVLAAALGVLGMVGLLSLESTGGSVLVPNNALGIAWTVTPTILAMIVVVWPRLPPRNPA